MAKQTKLKASSNRLYAKNYRTFRGVDFSKDASMVEDTRSPDAENIISDLDGFPEKRVGWRVLREFSGRINGIFTFGTPGNMYTVIHAGDKIYKICDEEVTCIYEGCADARSCGKNFNGVLCILTGSEFLVFDGEKCCSATEYEDVYATITHIQRMPFGLEYSYIAESPSFVDWNKNGMYPSGIQHGTVPEKAMVNLTSGWRKNTFEYPASGGLLVYALDATIDDGSRVVMRCMATGQTIFDIRYDASRAEVIGYYNISSGREGSEGVNENLVILQKIVAGPARELLWIGNSEKNNCGFIVIQINTTALSGYIKTAGVDDFSIEYSHSVEGYAERIEKCRFMDVFENRIFFSGNPDYPNVDWYSAVGDPLFVPDINYTEIGLSTSRIMGYLRTGSEQAILKSDGDGATIYMRSYSMLSDGSVIFPVKQGIGGLGAISQWAMTTFLDDPVYLTRNGVYALALQDISSERALNIRSTRINPKLLIEDGLSDAIMCEWDGLLLLCTDGKCFVADAAQKSYSGNKTGTYEYEWYYWTNIPARVFGEVEGGVFFGTDDGKLCRFNDDMVSERGELMSAAYSDNGAAICARWSTPLSDDGDFMRYKTMVKSGSGVFLKAYNRSGVSVCIRTDTNAETCVAERSAGRFTFEDIDFSDFTFNTSSYTVVPFNTRIKKYKAIQIICRNEKVNQAFGIGGITRKYFYGKTNK